MEADESPALVCPLCFRTFRRPEHLQRHTLTHGDDKKHACTSCDARYKRSDAFRRHWKTCAGRLASGDQIPKRGLSGKRKRACVLCTSRKRACSTGQPCSGCLSQGTVCTYNGILWRLYRIQSQLFGGTNEDIHALRRRQLSHGFSQVSIQKLEPLIEGQMEIFIRKLRSLVGSGETFDFKTIISLYILDILGEVAFAKPFGVQEKGYAEELHAINDHLLLAGVIRELTFQNFWKALSRMSPVSWMRQLMKSRNNLKTVCSDCVKFKMKNTSQRPDLLKSLVEAADPQCGARLTEQEINSEAFAVLVAGSHSTPGTLTLLHWNLIQIPEMLAATTREIQDLLGPLGVGQISYPIQGFEASLIDTMACVKENF